MTQEHVDGGVDDPNGSNRSVSPRVAVGAVVLVLAIILIAQNTDRGTVDFLWWTIDAPTWLWLLITFVAGVIVGSVLPWFRRRRRA